MSDLATKSLENVLNFILDCNIQQKRASMIALRVTYHHVSEEKNYPLMSL
jgi:hypothetical protein